MPVSFRALIVGKPLRSDRLGETLLPKRLALPVFCSDPLSSVAYATEQIILVLGLGGLALLHLTPWLAAAVVLLLMIVVASYRQTCVAYPNGGGAYAVSRDEPRRGRVARRRLRAADRLRPDGRGVRRRRRRGDHERRPGAAPHAVALSLAFVVLLTAANLRGVKESGRAFAVPTYGFVARDLRDAARRVREGRLRRRAHRRERPLPLARSTAHRRPAHRLPRAAGVRLGLHGADRRRGGLQRRARPSSSRRPATPRRRW